LSEGGFVEGQNVAIEFRWARGEYDRLPALAAELVSRHVAVLVGVGGDNSAVAAKKATSTIPVVFGMGGDPVKAGLVDSLNRPGGNATGFTLLTNQLEPKRVGLMRELVPRASLFGALLNPGFLPSANQLQDIEGAARAINLKLLVAKADNDTELDAAFVRWSSNGSALCWSPRTRTSTRDATTSSRSPHRTGFRPFINFANLPPRGGLISYGPRVTDGYQQAGSYVGRILRGAKPTDLPILQPTKFELVINLKTANALGLAVPNSMQLLADEVIE
jgi:putative ABC transport system substrate-binding protein